MKPDEFDAKYLDGYLKFMNLTRDGIYMIQYKDMHPVDLIIREKPKEVPQVDLSRSDKKKKLHYKVHFIKCTNYQEQLTLDAIAKAFVVTLCQNADSLTIATTKGFTPQAREYACKFFSGSLRDSINVIEWHPIEQDLFRHDPDALGEYRIVDIEMLLKKTFSDKNLAKDGRRPTELNVNDRIAIRLLLDCAAERGEPPRVNVKLQSDGGDVIHIGLNHCGILHKHDRFYGEFRGGNLRDSETYCMTGVEIIDASGKTIPLCGTERFIALYRSAKKATLPNLRPQESENLLNWVNDQQHNILLLEGEGGTGKTHLSSEICRQAVQDGFIVGHEVLSQESTPALLSNMFWIFFGANYQQFCKEDGYTFPGIGSILDYINNFLKVKSNILSREGSEELKALLLEGRVTGDGGETIVVNFTRLLMSIEKPLIFLFSNAHCITGAVSRCLRTMINTLASEAWKDDRNSPRLIIEARDTQEDLSQDWLNLRSYLLDRHSSALLRHQVKPLCRNDIESALQSTFRTDSIKPIIETIAKNCGGNPFFLSQFLQSMLERDIISHTLEYVGDSWESGYSVNSLPEFQKFTVKPEQDSERLLVKRFNHFHPLSVKRGIRHGCYYLGIMAILDMSIELDSMRNLFGIDTAECEHILQWFQGAGILTWTQMGQYVFSHEYLRAGARSWLKDRINGNDLDSRAEANSIFHSILAGYKNVRDFKIEHALGRICAFFSHPDAIAHFKAAISYAAASNNIGGRYSIHRGLHDFLTSYSGLDRQNTMLLHGNLSELAFFSYYTMHTDEQLKDVEDGILSAESALTLTPAERSSFVCAYCHRGMAISNKSANISEFLRYMNKSIDLVSDKSRLFGYIDRFVQFSTTSGDFENARRAALLAQELYRPHQKEKDSGYEISWSVVLHEMSVLYGLIAPECSLRLIETADAVNTKTTNPDKERQRVHDLLVMGIAYLRTGKMDMAEARLKEVMEKIEDLNMPSIKYKAIYLKGLIDSARGFHRSSVDSFQACVSDAEWYGHGRELLASESNLLVAFMATGLEDNVDKMHAIRLHQDIIARICRLGDALKKIDSNAIYDRLAAAYTRITGAAPERLKNAEVFPENGKRSFSRFAPVLVNLRTLSSVCPEVFPFEAEKFAQFERLQCPDIPTGAPVCATRDGTPLLMII